MHWYNHWRQVVSYEAPDAKWFVGGTTNLCYNCVDRHVDNGFGDQVGIIWEGEPIGDEGPEIIGSPTPSCSARLRSSQTCCWRTASDGAMSSPSTWA